MKTRRTKCYKEKQTHPRPIENTFLIKSECNDSIGNNQTVELIPRNKEEIKNNNKEECKRPFDHDTLSEIRKILQIISGFIDLFKSKSTVESVENLTVGETQCKSLFSDVLRERIIGIEPSDDFIYNTNIRGKSGSLIFYTADFKYAIKVIRSSELDVLRRNLQKMIKYCDETPGTYLCKIFGVFTTGRDHFVVMNNVLKSPCNQIYDLKGSNVERRFVGVNIEANWRGKRLNVRDRGMILSMFRNDVEFLRSLNLMDYSVLIGINEEEDSGFELFDGTGRMIRRVESNDIEEYSLGIVDVFTEYSFSKRVENIFQMFCCCSGNKSSKNPQKYSERFLDLIEKECFEEEELND